MAEGGAVDALLHLSMSDDRVVSTGAMSTLSILTRREPKAVRTLLDGRIKLLQNIIRTTPEMNIKWEARSLIQVCQAVLNVAKK